MEQPPLRRRSLVCSRPPPLWSTSGFRVCTVGGGSRATAPGLEVQGSGFTVHGSDSRVHGS
eukprot:1544247-Rhodomonas_salina.1